MDKVKKLASDLYDGIGNAGCDYFIGSVASLVESALWGGKENINVDKLLKAFADAKKYSEKEG